MTIYPIKLPVEWLELSVSDDGDVHLRFKEHRWVNQLVIDGQDAFMHGLVAQTLTLSTRGTVEAARVLNPADPSPR